MTASSSMTWLTLLLAHIPDSARKSNLGFGLHIYFSTPELQGLLVLSMATATAGAMVIVNTVVYVRDFLGATETTVAIAFAAFGLGSMSAAMSLPWILNFRTERSIMITGSVLLLIGLSAGLLQPQLPGLLAIWILLGLGSSLILTPSGRLLRRSCQSKDRAVLFAIQFALSHACWLLTYPLAGWLGAIDLTLAFKILAGIAAASTVTAMFIWPPER